MYRKPLSSEDGGQANTRHRELTNSWSIGRYNGATQIQTSIRPTFRNANYSNAFDDFPSTRLCNRVLPQIEQPRSPSQRHYKILVGLQVALRGVCSAQWMGDQKKVEDSLAVSLRAGTWTYLGPRRVEASPLITFSHPRQIIAHISRVDMNHMYFKLFDQIFLTILLFCWPKQGAVAE